MILRPRAAAAFVLLSLFVVAFLPYAFLKRGIAAPDFKQFAEAKAGEFLKAKVEIGKVRVRFPNKVVLADLKLTREKSAEGASHLEIGQLIFRYHFFQLFSRHLPAPSGMTIHAPKMLLLDSGFPYSLFQSAASNQKDSRFHETMNLEFAGGEARYQLLGLDAELFLTDIRGKISPRENGKFNIDLRSSIKGEGGGKIRIRGEVDPIRKVHHLSLELDSVSGNWGGPLSGKMRWEGNNLWIDRLRTKIQGWDSELRGSVTEGSLLQAEVQIVGLGIYQLNGKIVREQNKVLFSELNLSDGYHGNGSMDFSSADVRFVFQKENQRIATGLNLKKPGIHFNLYLDHIPVRGLDVVMAATIELTPLTASSPRAPKFHAEFKTDYFVLETTPFQDFKGQFDLGSTGIRNFSATWGEVFDLGGDIRFGRSPQAAFVLHVNGFDLKKVRQFASKPLPRALGGLLEGRLKIEGDYHHPEISGKFTVKDGRIGKLDYDLGIFQFRGMPPFLPLEDSRIFKGRSTLFLNGGIDFRRRNMFSGIRIQTDDKLIFWKGWEMNTSKDLGDLEIDTFVPQLPVFNVKPGQGDPGTGLPKDNQNSDDRYVAVGPKFKF